MQIIKTPKMNARLPATPCTPEMRESIAQIAERENVKMAEVQRTAIQFFLDQIDSKTVISDSKAEVQREEKTA